MIDGASSAIGSNGSLNVDEATDNDANQNISRRNKNNNNSDRSNVDADLEDSKVRCFPSGIFNFNHLY